MEGFEGYQQCRRREAWCRRPNCFRSRTSWTPCPTGSTKIWDMITTALGILAFLMLAGSMAIWFRKIQTVQIPENRSAFVATWAIAGLLGVTALVQGVGWIGGIPAGIAAFAGIFFTVLFFISPQKVGSDAIQVGARLPAFNAPDEHGEAFGSASLAGKPVLLKFFRGHW